MRYSIRLHSAGYQVFDVSGRAKGAPPMLLCRLLVAVFAALAVASHTAAQTPIANANLWVQCKNQQGEEAPSACAQLIDSKIESGVRLARAITCGQ
jgi:hypothetical protein